MGDVDRRLQQVGARTALGVGVLLDRRLTTQRHASAVSAQRQRREQRAPKPPG